MCFKRLFRKPVFVKGAVKMGKTLFNPLTLDGTFYIFSSFDNNYYIGFDNQLYRFSWRISKKEYQRLLSVIK